MPRARNEGINRHLGHRRRDLPPGASLSHFDSALTRTFVRRRNVWFALTIIALLSPNFWIFAFFAAPIYIWIGRNDSNPTAAYLMLMHVVPPVEVDIPSIGSMQLFGLDNYRLLSFCILIPMALRARRSLDRNRIYGSRMTDLLLLGIWSGANRAVRAARPTEPRHSS